MRIRIACLGLMSLFMAIALECRGAPPPAKQADRPVPSPIPDESLPADEYVKLGMPAYDRTWTSEDFVRVEKVLKAIAEKNDKELPRYKSPRSGEVFARLTSAANFDPYRDRTLAFKLRFGPALQQYETNVKILKIYVSAQPAKHIGDSELVELIALQLRGSKFVVELVDELFANSQAGRPFHAGTQEGIGNDEAGLAEVVSGSLQTLTEQTVYRDSELARLVDSMEETLPTLVPFCSRPSQIEMTQRIDTLLKDARYQELHPGLRKVQAKVKTALDKSAGP